MTVNSLFEDGGVQCVWHLADGSLQREGFFPGRAETGTRETETRP